MHSLYKCQIFQLYNFYVLYVLNTSHKLYLYMKLYMVSELSISCVLFTLTPPPIPRKVNVRAVRILLECILVHNAFTLIDTSDNASYNQVHWLIRTPYLLIKASNDIDT